MHPLKSILTSLGAVLLLTSCGGLYHSAYPISSSPIEKPVYDSVIRVSVPLKAGFGMTIPPWSFNGKGPNTYENNWLYSFYGEGGVSLATRFLSLGATGYYYSGHANTEIPFRYPNGATAHRHSYWGQGMRLNASIDWNFTTENDAIGVWRIINVQFNLAHEEGRYAQLREQFIENTGGAAPNESHLSVAPPGEDFFSYQIYTEAIGKLDSFQTRMYLGVSTDFLWRTDDAKETRNIWMLGASAGWKGWRVGVEIGGFPLFYAPSEQRITLSLGYTLGM